MSMVGFEKHDHTVCVDGMIAAAEAYCAENKLQFTSTRREVLELLLEAHKALGAYNILERLTQEGQRVQPPVAYRALDFLVKHGFAHKIEHLNAYIACAHPQESHVPAFMICRICNSVAETYSKSANGMLGQAAKESGFQIERTVVEAEGVCPRCVASKGVA